MKMRYIGFCMILLGLISVVNADTLSNLKEKMKTIGKQSPIDIQIYAKNSSHKCALSITNIINPYKKDLTKEKLVPVSIVAGGYYREDIMHLLKGSYEFEFTWRKDEKFIDSKLRTVHIFAYHDSRNKIHKKVNLTFLLRVPKMCK